MGCLLASLIALLGSSGCATMNEFCDELAVRAMVRQAQHEYCVPSHLGPAEAVHFRSGWREGYYSVATGGDGCPPLVPPKKYWKLVHPHRGAQVDIWYRGFACGAAAAHSEGAQDGYFVPVMGCGCSVGGPCQSCSSPCCPGGQFSGEVESSLRIPEPLELSPEPAEKLAIPLSHREPVPTKPRREPQLKYPNDILPRANDAMLWEEPLANSTSSWFRQPVVETMNLVAPLDAVIAEVEAVPSSREAGPLSVQKLLTAAEPLSPSAVVVACSHDGFEELNGVVRAYHEKLENDLKQIRESFPIQQTTKRIR